MSQWLSSLTFQKLIKINKKKKKSRSSINLISFQRHSASATLANHNIFSWSFYVALSITVKQVLDYIPCPKTYGKIRVSRKGYLLVGWSQPLDVVFVQASDVARWVNLDHPIFVFLDGTAWERGLEMSRTQWLVFKCTCFSRGKGKWHRTWPGSFLL